MYIYLSYFTINSYFFCCLSFLICPPNTNTRTDVVCEKKNIFTKVLSTNNVMPHEHVYNLKMPTFYFCKDHAHKHISHPTLDCVIQMVKCCPKAVYVKDYEKCFSVTTTASNSGFVSKVSEAKKFKYGRFNNDIALQPDSHCPDNRSNPIHLPNATKSLEYIIFDPTIWREQSYNHFMSFIRAIISSPHVAAERYKRFESSNFAISNIKKYKSGKESIIRTAVTGFETQGIYQTSTISCMLPYYSVMIPQKLYDLLKEAHYDLDLVLTKRDPSLLQTCMYVNAVIRNPNPEDDVIKISDQQAKGFNQDQDGDKNPCYPLLKVINGYDATQSYKYKVAKMELAAAFRKKTTLVASPRYLLSETSLLIIERFRHELGTAGTEKSQIFFNKTHMHGIRFMNEASAGYLSEEYDHFQKTLIEYNKNKPLEYITTDDILLKTSTKLSSIITSEAKGNKDLLDMLLNNISSEESLANRKKEMIDLCNKYIVSSQDLSRNGRKQFTALYAAQDLVAFNGNIYINKVFFANYTQFASTGMFLFNEASLELCVQDLFDL